jgi:hypothetical protein
VTPTIDGEITNYFEWVGAGSVEGAAAGGAMHQVSDQAAGIAAVEFGFDLENLYVRVDGTSPVTEMLAAGFGFELRFLSPVGLRVEVEQAGTGAGATLYRSTDGDRWSAVPEPSPSRGGRPRRRVPDPRSRCSARGRRTRRDVRPVAPWGYLTSSGSPDIRRSSSRFRTRNSR